MNIFKKLFKNRRTYNLECSSLKVETSCEDENTVYVTYPDGLRLIFRYGKYAGWYVYGEGKGND